MSFEEFSESLLKEGFKQCDHHSYSKKNLIIYKDKSGVIRASFRNDGERKISSVERILDVSGTETLLKISYLTEEGLKRFIGVRY